MTLGADGGCREQNSGLNKNLGGDEKEIETGQKNTENNFKDGGEVEDTDKEEMVIQKRVHVIKIGEEWGIVKDGSNRAIRTFKSKREAIEGARIFKKRGYDLLIYNEDGSIQKREKSQKKKTLPTPAYKKAYKNAFGKKIF